MSERYSCTRTRKGRDGRKCSPPQTHHEGERGSSRRKRDDDAKAVCRTCPVIIDCRNHALATHEPYGVWGGMTEEERRAWIDREENGRGTPVA